MINRSTCFLPNIQKSGAPKVRRQKSPAPQKVRRPKSPAAKSPAAKNLFLYHILFSSFSLFSLSLSLSLSIPLILSFCFSFFFLIRTPCFHSLPFLSIFTFTTFFRIFLPFYPRLPFYFSLFFPLFSLSFFLFHTFYISISPLYPRVLQLVLSISLSFSPQLSFFCLSLTLSLSFPFMFFLFLFLLFCPRLLSLFYIINFSFFSFLSISHFPIFFSYPLSRSLSFPLLCPAFTLAYFSSSISLSLFPCSLYMSFSFLFKKSF
ncbi:unnamed protein product [Acanthosepion pharaonis]|uniref:Uncharacterized protein n=1 Tax=Acanthosepion pharaonis TaxID=158019 RepID=A0A812EN11_ACAPH|nr:unnamed protein product [Sepia pharaonis]